MYAQEEKPWEWNWEGIIKILPKQVDANSKTIMAVDFSTKHQQFWSCGFVCQTKKMNACGHIPVHDWTMAYSVNSKGQTLFRGKSKDENLRESILDPIIMGSGDLASWFSFVALWVPLNGWFRSANNKLNWRSQQGERNVSMYIHLMDLTNKATWLKSLTFGATVNCHACLWIRGLPGLVEDFKT